MGQPDRRLFLGQSMLGAAAMAITSHAGQASNEVHLGVIGCGGRGTHLAQHFSQIAGVKIAAVSDPDKNRMEQLKNAVGAPVGVTDMRKIFDDKSIQAVIIATPDHWHAPAAILACEAGKHVYVEKPCSHNIREGRLLVEAARKNSRLVQHGTQSRSMAGFAKAWEELRKGTIGEVLMAKVINNQRRDNIGKAGPSSPPNELDFDLWVGPAPMMEYQPNLLHYHWHWFFTFGTGDIGNDGVHQLDVARWGMGVTGHPSKVFGYGSKLYFDDDQQFPDTYVITFEYPGAGPRQMPLAIVFEQRIWAPYRTESVGNGNIFYGSEGMLVLERGRMHFYGKDNKLIKKDEFPVTDVAHFVNFIEAVRGNATLNAPIEVGHQASVLAHLGNIVARSGKNIVFDPETEQIKSPKKLAPMVTREYRDGHWAVPKDS